MPGVLGLNHRNTLKILKNLILQNHLAQMLDILYAILPNSLSQILFKSRPAGSKMALPQGVLGSAIEKQKKIYKHLLHQNHLAQMLEIWYGALPSGLLPNLFK